MIEPIVVVGASVRAAAHSVRRTGHSPFAADLFADRDLQDCCPTIRVADYPDGFSAAVREFPPAPWLYCGGLENYPDVVDAISAERTLLGNPGRVLRRVRDPLALTEALRAAGLDVPEVALSLPQDRRGVWLRKPLRSSAGYGIHRIPEQVDASLLSDDADSYYQQQIDGVACGAVFVATAGAAELLGISEQLVGCESLSASVFRYCGSMGPLPTSDVVRETFLRMGNCLAERFELAGLFGVDAIVAGDRVWPVEVNPRYTASVEILERSLGVAAMRLHVDACRGQSPSLARSIAATKVCGKAIIFANRTTVVPHEFAEFVSRLNRDAAWPEIADIPHVGSVVEKHQPITTLFADGESLESVRAQLLERARAVRTLVEDERSGLRFSVLAGESLSIRTRSQPRQN